MACTSPKNQLMQRSREGRQEGVRSSLRVGRVTVNVVVLLCCHARETRGDCEFGSLPGTIVSAEEGKHTWQVYDRRCQLRSLLPTYLGLAASEGEDVVKEQDIKDVTMLLLGDSIDRATVWDVNDTAHGARNSKLQSMLNEHWRVALRLPHLEMVYQFAPGSHMIGPYHDDVPWNMTIANALPRGFELHRLLTGRESPNVVVFSNILWDLGRWLFLSEIAEPERMEHFGKPLLREQEFLPVELLEEWRQDTLLQMKRIEKRVDHDALLIYHNAAFALLADCKNGTHHIQKGLGKRTHLIQLNALARQVVSENPRWHMVDFGAMSESFLSGRHLRDFHHPNQQFMLQAMNMYLNLNAMLGSQPRPVTSSIGDVARWDAEFLTHAEEMQQSYLNEAKAEEGRLAYKRESHRSEEHAGKRNPKGLMRNLILNFRHG